MHTPPFRLLRAGNSGNYTSRYTGNAAGPDTGGSTDQDIGNTAGNYGLLAGVCCALPLAPPPAPVRRRTRLGDLAAQVDTLRVTLSMRDERLALHTSRRETAEQRAIDAGEKAAALRTALDNALALTATTQAKSNAMEYAMLLSITQAATDRPGLERLHGKRIVYAGGRPGSNTVIKRLVESAGGKFMVRDGGIEIRKGMLATVLQRAGMVLFPVDCIDHDSMHTLKRVCERHQVAYYPLRTASVACFLELMTCAGMDGTREMAGPPLSRFCLRHG